MFLQRKNFSQVTGLLFGSVGVHTYPKSGQVPPSPLRVSSLFLVNESSSEIYELIACYNALFLPFRFDFTYKCKQNVDVLSAVRWQI